MNYMLLVYVKEEARTPDMPQGCGGLLESLQESGHYVDAARLQPASTATSVRVREGRPLFTDGPFAETREHLAGYMLIRASSLEEAQAIAARHPAAQFGTVEIRAVLDDPVPAALQLTQ